MPQPRRPTALGVAPPKVPGPPKAGDREDEDERTTVDDPSTLDTRDRWEEQTQREGAARRLPPRPGVLPVREDSGEVLRDSVDSMDEELTVRADEQTVRADESSIAEGSSEVGNSTVDEPTVEDSERPLPPLSVVPPIPQGKGRAVPRRAAAASVAAGQLVCIAGNDTGRTFELTGKKITVGRGVDCDLVLTDIAVSRRHIELSFDGKAYTLRDLGSGNGTLINDRLEDGSCQLRDGDRLELGNTVLRFEHSASRSVPAVVGFGQVEVDEEASTIAGNVSGRHRKGAPLPPPHGERRLVLPPLPPGAVAGADGPPVVPFGESPLFYPAGPTHPDAVGMVSLPGYADGALLPIKRNAVLIGVVAGALLIVLVAIIATIARSSDGDEPGQQVAIRSERPGAAAAPVVAASRTPLPASTWGTDERMLAARAPAPAAGATRPAGAPPARVAPVVDPPAPAPAPVKVAPPPPTPVKVAPPPAKTTPPARTAPPPPKMTARRPEPRPDPPKRTVTPSPKAGKTAAARTTAARKKADGLYRGKQFSAAAAALRDAAGSATEAEATTLRALATDYEAVGANLSKGQATQASSPTESMGAYLRALSLDKSVGGAAHASFIRIKLGQVAPSAAASYMAQKRYEAAKKAADAAVNYGAGGDATVRRVLGALERQAAQMYATASKGMKSDPDGAKKLLRRIIKMVPADSPTYASAYRLLNARKNTARDEDE